MKHRIFLSLTALIVAAWSFSASAEQDKDSSASQHLKAPVKAVTTTVDNQALELKISNAFHADPELKGQVHLNVIVLHGIVLLTGETPSPALRSKAVKIAKQHAQQHRVQNEIAVAQPSSLTSRSKDTWITTKVKSALLGDEGLKGLKIKVVTENRVVYLMGQVSHKEARAAVKRAKTVPEVKDIVTVFSYSD